MDNSRKDELIEKLGLQPLEREGGYYGFITKFGSGSGSIYYLMTEEEFSHMHSLTEDELWFFLEGDEVEQTLVSPEGVISTNLLNDDHRSILIKKGCFQASKIKRIEKGYALLSTVMSPSYQDSMYTHGADVPWLHEIDEIQYLL